MKTVQMTLDEDLIRAVDNAARKLRKSRPAFAREALRSALKEVRLQELESRHREGYRHKPVKRGEFSGWESEQIWVINPPLVRCDRHGRLSTVLPRGKYMLMHTLACGRTLCVGVLVAVGLGSCASPDLSTPEKTIATYYKGYTTGNKSLTEKTLMGMGPLSDVGFSPPSVHSYRIIEIKEVLERSTSAEIGDLEVITEVFWTPQKSERMWYVLRKYGKEWKIVALSAVRSEL